MAAPVLHFPVPAAVWPPPAPTLVQRLVFSLRELHRPEVADMVLSGTISLVGRVMLVEPHPLWRAELRAVDARRWYEELLTLAGLRVGLPLDSTVLCLPPERVSESAEGGADPGGREKERGREGVHP